MEKESGEKSFFALLCPFMYKMTYKTKNHTKKGRFVYFLAKEKDGFTMKNS